MDRLEAMTIFVGVTEAGSLTGCSRKMRIPLTTVSRNISEIEEYLGAKLLHRSTRKLELTDAGRNYLESCKRILGDVDEAEKAAKGEFSTPKGSLVIAAPLVFGRLHLLPLVSEFLKSYPQIDIQLMLADQVVDLIEGKIDLALRIGALQDSSMMMTRVGVTRKVTVASPGYLAANGTPKKLEDLKNHNCISIEPMGAVDSWKYFKEEKAVNVAVRPRLVVSTIEAGLDAATSGVGVTRALCYQVNAALVQEKLKLILKSYEPEPVPISLLYHGSRVFPEKLRAFLAFVAPKLKEKLAQK